MISAKSPVRTHPSSPHSFNAFKSSKQNLKNSASMSQGGIDLFRAVNIFVYRNGDPHFLGRKIVVSAKKFKNFEQFLSTLTAEIRLHSGAVRRVYDLKGHRVLSISDLMNYAHYVAAGNEPFKTISYPLIDPQPSSSSKEKPSLQRHPRTPSNTTDTKQRSHSTTSIRQEESPFTNNNNKAIRVAIFRNGDISTPPQKMVLSQRNCRTFDQFVSEATALMKLKEGRIRRLFDAQTGKQLTTLLDLKDGQNLIASGTLGPMIKKMYPFLDFHLTSEVRRLSWLSKETNTLITVYPNGDVIHTGVKVTVNPYRFRDLKMLLKFLDHEIPLYTGHAAELFTLTGTKVTELAMLEHQGHYVVAAGMDPFIKGFYNSDRYHKSMLSLHPTPFITTKSSSPYEDGKEKEQHDPDFHSMYPIEEKQVKEQERESNPTLTSKVKNESDADPHTIQSMMTQPALKSLSIQRKKETSDPNVSPSPTHPITSNSKTLKGVKLATEGLTPS